MFNNFNFKNNFNNHKQHRIFVSSIYNLKLLSMCGIIAFFKANDTRAEFIKKLETTFVKHNSRGPEMSTFSRIGSSKHVIDNVPVFDDNGNIVMEKQTMVVPNGQIVSVMATKTEPVERICDSNLFFGFHRLAINGLDAGSNQPIARTFEVGYIKKYTNVSNVSNVSNPEPMRLTVICNGEIYNSKEIHESVGDTPVTNSDCESIIIAYATGGPDAIASLDGVFAFALYVENDYWADGKTTLTFSRDPFGVRPLYTFQGDDGFGVASDLNTFSTVWIWDEIKEFQPGTWVQYIIDRDTGRASYLREDTYFTPFGVISSGDNQMTIETASERIRNSLVRAVRKRVVDTCERPIACLLSGGLDSSLICSIVVRVLKEEYGPNFDTRSVRTFSIGFGEDDPTDFAYAREVAEHLGTTHTEIRVSFKDALEAIPEVVRAIGSYDVTTVRASVGNYLVAKAIRETCDAKVIMNGDGADEVMGGYLYFGASPTARSFDVECRRLLRDIHMYDVLRSDRSIAMNGLEARTPYLDREFVGTYLSLPCKMRAWNMNQGRQCEKWLIRTAFSDTNEWLPKSVLWRKKEAFSDGVSSLKKSWFEVVDEYVREKGYDGEKAYYMELMTNAFGEMSMDLIPYMWMPRWCEAKDASARTLGELYSRERE